MTVVRLLLFLCFFLSLRPCVAQQQKPVSYTLNTPRLFFEKPPLLNQAGVNYVNCIFKDSRHLMWFGTNNGLFRFDGTNVVYTHNRLNDAYSLPDNVVLSIAEDRQGLLWIGTLQGVGIVDPITLRCINVPDEHNNVISRKFRLATDAEGDLWGYTDLGIYRFNPRLRRLQFVWGAALPGHPNSATVTGVCSYGKGQLAVSTLFDVVLLDKQSFRYSRIAMPEFPVPVVPTSICSNYAGELWVSSYNGLLHRRPGSASWEQTQFTGPAGEGGSNILFNLLRVQAGNAAYLFAGTPDGLLSIPLNDSGQPKTNAVALYRHEANDEGSMLSSGVGALLQDEQGNLWIGGSGNDGLARTRPGRPVFQQFSTIPGLAFATDTLSIGGAKMQYVSIWHGTAGLLLVDKTSGKQRLIRQLPGDTGPGATNISALATDGMGRVWASSWTGVTVMDENLHVLKKITAKTGGGNNLSSSKALGLLISGDTTWVSVYDNGIDLFRTDGTKLKHYNVASNRGLQDNLIWRLHRDSHGTKWLYGNQFLYRYDAARDSFIACYFSGDNSAYLPFQLAEESDGHLLVATHRGLVRFSESGPYEYLKAPHAEREDNVNWVCVDSSGSIWYITDEHLVSYNAATRSYEQYGVEDGLDLSADLCTLSDLGGGRFLIGMDKKLSLFTKPERQAKAGRPGVLINSISVNDSLIPGHNSADISLPYNRNRIGFEFSCINYDKPEQNLFAYRLLGADSAWHYTTKGDVAYPTLSPGRYQFEVKAADYAKTWSDVRKVSIQIARPYWRTLWFELLELLLAAGLLTFIIRYIAQRNLREHILKLEKAQAVEKERNRIARDVHDDLGSGLTKIAIMSEVMKKHLAQPEKVLQHLEGITAVSHELIDNLQDIIWVLDPKNDTLESLAAYLREYTLTFFELFDIEVAFDYPERFPDLHLSEEQRRNLFLTAKECCNNISKHAACSLVAIRIAVRKGWLELTIRDNGRGFDREHVRRYGNGLHNMGLRIADIGGRIDITSQPGAGSSISIALPVGQTAIFGD